MSASTNSKQGTTNPFYRNSTPTTSAPVFQAPPSYTSPSAQHTSSVGYEPVQYGSLSDLTSSKSKTKGRKEPAAFEYTPQPERQGYRSSGFEASDSNGRRLPPMPQEGMMPSVPPQPPRRNADQAQTAPTLPPRTNSGYQSYIPAGAQGGVDTMKKGFNSASERVVDGFNTVATQQRKDQVLGGIGRLGVGAMKLAGKGVYQVGKYATK